MKAEPPKFERGEIPQKNYDHLMQLRASLDPQRQSKFDELWPVFARRAMFRVIKGGKA